MTIKDILYHVEQEGASAAAHGLYHSPHEAYGVLMEEVDEFFDEVKRKRIDPLAMRKELIQVAAVAVRAIHDLKL